MPGHETGCLEVRTGGLDCRVRLVLIEFGSPFATEGAPQHRGRLLQCRRDGARARMAAAS